VLQTSLSTIITAHSLKQNGFNDNMPTGEILTMYKKFAAIPHIVNVSKPIERVSKIIGIRWQNSSDLL
jgi:hypothetical protein